MGLDIRYPIGMMFTLIGLLLAISGFLTRDETSRYQCSLGININLLWGLALLVFGAAMWVFALLGRREDKSQSQASRLSSANEVKGKQSTPT
ncbi:MAG: hypothetical protein ACRDBP_14155 [Luteolibacter sp.]